MKGPLRVLLVGAAGRMGEAIRHVAPADKIEIAPCELGDDLASALSKCDVGIDFSNATVCEALCAAAREHRKPLVIGTTGHSEQQRQMIKETATDVAIVYASNFSVGVNVLFALTERAGELLGGEFDIEVIEAHHRMKKDAPSGTAKALLEILQGTRREARIVHGREGDVGSRPDNEIAVHSIRGGDIVGDHTIIFAGLGERLQLTHKAGSRETFARGALRAAEWVVDQPAGLYDMRDVLALK